MATQRPRTRRPRSRTPRAASATSARRRPRVRVLAQAPPVPDDDRAHTIVYVHGIGNKPIESILKCQWDHALFGFDLGARSRLAYWVNRDYYPAPEEATCGSGDRVALEAAPTGRALSLARQMEEVQLEDEAAALTRDPRRQAALVRMARAMDARRVPERTVSAGSGVTAFILPLPPALRRWITRRLTRAFMRDVHDYLFVAERRRLMRESVIERLRVGGGPFVIIAHSQGSMIAYDVLRSLAPEECRVSLFVTIGSPLGIAEVQDQLKVLTGQKKLEVPVCVERWLNVCDERDPVAADETLADDFTPRGAIEDHKARNLDSPAHPHSGTGYLRIESVRQRVRDAVRTELFQPVAPFVIARNLVRRLENAPREARHPLLIELAEPPMRAASEDLAQTRARLVDRILTLSGRTPDALRLDPMRRFVAADLTREEAEALASQADPFPAGGPLLKRIWRNEARHALLDTSIHTVHAGAAHASYHAHGRGVAWAVLDSGVNAAHPHFQPHGTIAAQFDCTKRGVTAGTARDEHGHGTHVAGIIAGTRAFVPAQGPARTFAGVAPEAALHIYKVLDADGNGEDAFIIKALDHIADANEKAGRLVIHGVNLSLGGPFDPSAYGCGHTPLCEELRRLWRQGVLVVVAAGNEGFAVLRTLEGEMNANLDLSIGDPANLQDAIAVGSVHKERPHTFGVSYFSSRGPTADGRQKPDLVAPGERIESCRHDFVAGGSTPESFYVAMSGTSMAAPHVSGVLAAFLSVRQEFIGEPDRVKELLLRTAIDLGRDRLHQGAGVPNLVRMLQST